MVIAFQLIGFWPRLAHIFKSLVIKKNPAGLLVSTGMQNIPTNNIQTSSFPYCNPLQLDCDTFLLCHNFIQSLTRLFLIYSREWSDLSEQETKELKIFGKSELSTPFTPTDLNVSLAHWILEAIISIPCRAALRSPLLCFTSILSLYFCFAFLISSHTSVETAFNQGDYQYSWSVSSSHFQSNLISLSVIGYLQSTLITSWVI